MAFFHWQTDFDDYRAWCKTQRGNRKVENGVEYYQQCRKFKVASEYYAWRNENIRTDEQPPSTRNAADLTWTQDGCPYYNVHPQLASKLCDVSLGKVPTYLVELPHDLNAVNIRFNQQHPELSLTDSLVPEANPPKGYQSIVLPKNSFVHSMLMLRGSDGISFIIDLDVKTNGPRTLLFAPLAWNTNEDTLVDSLQILKERQSEAYCDLVANCCKLAVTIGFMANSSSELITPDVLAKDRQRYDTGNDEVKAKCVNRAIRRGKFGWNVGNDLMFLGERDSQHHAAEGERGELNYSHLRGGHPHAVRYGKGKKKVKIMWFRPTRVRADLPFKK